MPKGRKIKKESQFVSVVNEAQRLEVYLQVQPTLALDGEDMSDLPSGKVGGSSPYALKVGWLAATIGHDRKNISYVSKSQIKI
jgi:hypothetical protein